jgi:hypothetical protein
VKSPWPELPSKPHQPSDRRLSAKLVPTFADRVPRCQSDGFLRPYSILFYLISFIFTFIFISILFQVATQLYFSENLIAPGIEPGHLDP